MAWVLDNEGELINLDHVARTTKSTKERMTLLDREGRTLGHVVDVDAFDQAITPVIPGNHTAVVLTIDREAKKVWADRWPIIGWRLHSDTCVVPVLPQYFDSSEKVLIELPDGQLAALEFSGMWRSVEDAVKDICKDDGYQLIRSGVE